jgi:hypothetical protein
VIRVEAKIGEINALLARVSGATPAALAVGALRGAQHVAGEIRSTLFDVVRGSSQSPLTGRLARSWRERLVVAEDQQATAEAYSDLAYARIQDEGGTITPRVRKYLAIPLIRMPVGKWPRDWPAGALSFVPTRRGGVLVRRAKKGRGEAVYALVRSVRIPAKRYVEKAVRKAEPEIPAIMDAAIQGELARGGVR